MDPIHRSQGGYIPSGAHAPPCQGHFGAMMGRGSLPGVWIGADGWGGSRLDIRGTYIASLIDGPSGPVAKDPLPILGLETRGFFKSSASPSIGSNPTIHRLTIDTICSQRPILHSASVFAPRASLRSRSRRGISDTVSPTDGQQ